MTTNHCTLNMESLETKKTERFRFDLSRPSPVVIIIIIIVTVVVIIIIMSQLIRLQ